VFTSSNIADIMDQLPWFSWLITNPI
jgi:hypothetical protein